ncbi:hypothetical protein HELRODRAFT_165437 [Helobdella robusta]|uniref:CCHC-type domain-containing protein n=1 Tax=Helobdella robusta TaxID=6412 RepID=T1EWS6_HELRO|nr:hypothetical protein HELRODRAFT_165437 [Helobdella robusta]ESN91406.1 hypothetical protein HELRODRAFT_165437 [Helobdella robusta]
MHQQKLTRWTLMMLLFSLIKCQSDDQPAPANRKIFEGLDVGIAIVDENDDFNASFKPHRPNHNFQIIPNDQVEAITQQNVHVPKRFSLSSWTGPMIVEEPLCCSGDVQCAMEHCIPGGVPDRMNTQTNNYKSKSSLINLCSKDSTLLSSEEVETVSARTWSQHWQEQVCILTSTFYFGFFIDIVYLFGKMEKDMRERREADIQLRSQNNNAQQGDHTASIIRRISPMLGMCPMIPREIAAYFQRIEGIFDSHRNEGIVAKKHVLAQEGEEWLTHERLANVVEIYEANMNMRLSSNVASGYKPLQTAVRLGTDPKWLNKEVVKESISKVGCYHCGSRGHLAKFCTQKTNHNPIKKLIKCQVIAMSRATKELKKPGITPGTIQAEKYFKRPFVQVKIQAGLTCAALVDSGAEVCGISQNLCHKLNIPRGERLRIKGCTSMVVELLKMTEQYLVPAVKLEMTKNITPIKLGNESIVRSDRRDDVDAAKRRVSENDDKGNDESIVRSHEVNKAGTHTVHNNNSNNNKRNVGRYEVAHNSSNWEKFHLLVVQYWYRRRLEPKKSTPHNTSVRRILHCCQVKKLKQYPLVRDHSTGRNMSAY